MLAAKSCVNFDVYSYDKEHLFQQTQFPLLSWKRVGSGIVI